MGRKTLGERFLKTLIMWIYIDEKLFELLLAKDLDRQAIQMVLNLIEKYQDGPNDQAYRNAIETEDGVLECDPDAVVSVSSDGGAYVQTWVWVSDEEAGLKEEEVS